MSYRLALVDYLNTWPFLRGLQQLPAGKISEIIRVTPARCATLYQEGKVDISLCPVGALDDMPPYEIISDYAIGADGPVNTVMLLSQVPLESIQAVRLDAHSRTSNILLQVLATHYWQSDWEFYAETEDAQPESCLMIGDKVFAHADAYPYAYDLAAAWKAFTGLPMVFAVWIATPGIGEGLSAQLNEVFKKGISDISDTGNGLKDWQKDYLLHSISYPLDDAKRKAMTLYLDQARRLALAQVTR